MRTQAGNIAAHAQVVQHEVARDVGAGKQRAAERRTVALDARALQLGGAIDDTDAACARVFLRPPLACA